MERAATKIASLLIGKGKAKILPNMDCGDYVVVINSDFVKVTRGKELKRNIIAIQENASKWIKSNYF